MRDGVRIAVDVLRPRGGADAALPTVMMMARYWRSFALRVPAPRGKAPLGPRAPLADALLAEGYAVVVVDARGTGASEGAWPHPWSAAELADYRKVVDWIVAQPWSNGRVGATGISYEGTTAMLLAATGHPAVRAVAPRSFELDLFPDVVRPGGVLNQVFLNSWSESVGALDADRAPALFGTIGRIVVKGVRRVDEDPSGVELARLVAARRNPAVLDAVAKIAARDDRYGGQAVTLDDISVRAHLPALREAAVPAQLWASWMDATTADAALQLYAALPSVRELRIGAWSHTGEQHASPFREGGPPDPPLPDQWREILRFLAGPLQRDEPPHGERLIHYFTMGAERWTATPSWPPAGTRIDALHVGPAGMLSAGPPDRPGSEEHAVDPRASTGRANRWHTQMARPVKYGDRAGADRRLATWTAAPLDAPLEITGHPEVELFVRLPGDDAALFAYLEAVSSAGRVHLLSEGVIRVQHRPAGDTPPTFRRADLRPVAPGQLTAIRLRLLPTSVRIPPGWRVRLALAFADAETFAPLSGGTPPRVTVAYGPDAPSRLLLPVARAPGA